MKENYTISRTAQELENNAMRQFRQNTVWSV